MTHLPPIPDAANAPYPPHPAPISEEQKHASALAAEAAEKAAAQRAAEQRQLRTAAAVGAGLGTALLLGAAAWGWRTYTRRAPTVPARVRRARTADDKTKRGTQDRVRVAAGQPYEVSYFARKHKISTTDARAIIKQAGSDRNAANELARARKK